MKTLWGMPIRIIKKGKTRGRPSKAEKSMSQFMSWYMEKPAIKKQIQKAQMDMVLYGFSIIPSKLAHPKIFKNHKPLNPSEPRTEDR